MPLAFHIGQEVELAAFPGVKGRIVSRSRLQPPAGSPVADEWVWWVAITSDPSGLYPHGYVISTRSYHELTRLVERTD